MEYSLYLSPKATEDILNTCDYVRKDGEGTALNQARVIIDAIERLRDFPDIGKRLQNYIEKPTDYRYIIIDKVYLAFYLLIGNEVRIIRVFRKEQDYLIHLELD